MDKETQSAVVYCLGGIVLGAVFAAMMLLASFGCAGEVGEAGESSSRCPESPRWADEIRQAWGCSRDADANHCPVCLVWITEDYWDPIVVPGGSCTQVPVCAERFEELEGGRRVVDHVYEDCKIAARAHCSCADARRVDSLDAQGECVDSMLELCLESPELPAWTIECQDELFALDCPLGQVVPEVCRWTR